MATDAKAHPRDLVLRCLSDRRSPVDGLTAAEMALSLGETPRAVHRALVWLYDEGYAIRRIGRPGRYWIEQAKGKPRRHKG